MTLKNNLWKPCLLIILLAAGLLCVYAVGRYHDDSSGGSRFNMSQLNAGPVQPQTQDQDGMRRQSPRGQSPGQEQEGGRRINPEGASVPNTGTENSANLSNGLLIYAGIFFMLSCAVCYLAVRRKIKLDPDQAKWLILTLLGVGFLLRVAAATLMSGHPFDISTFRSWATAAANNLFQVYDSGRSSDYPPLYMYILFIAGKLGSLPVLSGYYPLLLKLPSMIADIATAFLIYRVARKYLSQELSILLSAFYVFNPAIIINSAWWGQVDSFFTLIAVLGVWALTEKKMGLAGSLFIAAVLMKPQGIIFLPVLGFELIRQKSLKSLLKTAAGVLGTALLVVLPFAVHYDAGWIFRLYAQTIGEYPYASVNAFNLFSLLGANYKSDELPWLFLNYHIWGLIFICLVTAYSWFIYIKAKSTALIPAAALLQIAGVFTLATGMHERYLFPAAALAILAGVYLRDRRLWFLAAGFSATIFINTHVILFGTLQGMSRAAYSPIMIMTALGNVLLLIYLGKVLLDLAHIHKIKAAPTIAAAAQ